MDSGNPSITRRLIVSVLVLEFLAGVALVAAVAVNERHVQYRAFDANLRAASTALLGDVQEAVDTGVRLDVGKHEFAREAVFRVTEEDGHVLGSQGVLPAGTFAPEEFVHTVVGGRSYRFFTVAGDKVIDPWKDGGIRHNVLVVYGLPDGHVWHEVLEAIRFFAVATAILLGLTAWLLVWLVRRLLSPFRALAEAADGIDSRKWFFDPPESSRSFVEVRPLTEAIERTIGRLQMAFEQQKRFTSDAAHELKTDVAIVKSSLQLLTMRSRTAGEYARGLATGLKDLGRLESTVQRMLTLARLEQAESSGEARSRFDHSLLSAVRRTRPLAEMRSIRVLVLSFPNAWVPIDEEDATLLCSNILLNAIQHSKEGGVVDITLSVEQASLRLTVRDRGEGIGNLDQSLLFEPFFRGDASRSRKSGGTGLGLAICRAICDRSGSDITISNHEDGGSVVTVILPYVEQKEVRHP